MGTAYDVGSADYNQAASVGHVMAEREGVTLLESRYLYLLLGGFLSCASTWCLRLRARGAHRPQAAVPGHRGAACRLNRPRARARADSGSRAGGIQGSGAGSRPP